MEIYYFSGLMIFIFENKVYDISQPENPLLFAELDNFGVVSIDAENGILFAGFTVYLRLLISAI